MQIFLNRAFLRAAPYLSLLNFEAFRVFKLEIRAWPLRCICLFGREEVPKELMYCIRC